VMEPARDFALNAHCPLSVALLRTPFRTERRRARVTPST
jgi:hypothetical protein